jgi:uncharacterized protein
VIIDSHLHIGRGPQSENVVTETQLISALDDNLIDGAIVMPHFRMSNEKAANDEVGNLVAKYPKRFWGVMTYNPHTGPDSAGKLHDTEDDFFREVERCVKQLKFVGIKLHPAQQWCAPNSKDAIKIFKAAKDFNVPVLIHTGHHGIPFTLPSMIIPPAKQFPEVKIIMSHAGAYVFAMEAIIVARECPNVYLETSLCLTTNIKRMIDELGVERVMFGSDLLIQMSASLSQYRSLKLSPTQMERCFSGTAREVFRLTNV